MFAPRPLAQAAPDLDQLKLQAAQRDPRAVEAVGREFENLFGEMMVGAMRQASLGDSMFPGDAAMYREMYDKQIVKGLTANGGLGIADMLVGQLRQQGLAPGAEDGDATMPMSLRLPPTMANAAAAAPPAMKPAPASGLAQYQTTTALSASSAMAAPNPFAGASYLDATPSLSPSLPALPAMPVAECKLPTDTALTATTSATAITVDPATLSDERQAFVAKVWPHAERAARALGVPTEIVFAQAALETGWGKSKLARDSNNIFGIKATGGWTGARVDLPTHEVLGGQNVRVAQSFRGYDDVASSFEDYVNLLKNSPRYANALATGGDARAFAQGLQRAGYATDPAYADKLMAIANGPTLRHALAAVTQPAATPAATVAKV